MNGVLAVTVYSDLLLRVEREVMVMKKRRER